MTLELVLKILIGELILCPRCKGNPEFKYDDGTPFPCQLCKLAQGGSPYVPWWFA